MKMRNKERMEMQLFICIKDKQVNSRHLDCIWGPFRRLPRKETALRHVGFQNKMVRCWASPGLPGSGSLASKWAVSAGMVVDTQCGGACRVSPVFHRVLGHVEPSRPHIFHKGMNSIQYSLKKLVCMCMGWG